MKIIFILLSSLFLQSCFVNVVNEEDPITAECRLRHVGSPEDCVMRGMKIYKDTATEEQKEYWDSVISARFNEF